jgi:hypothetical protein
MLEAIARIFMEKKLVGSTWQEETQRAGDEVRLYREYYDGEHRLKLTSEMKKMMQINDDRLDRYNDNYCAMVVDAMADRMTVDRIAVSKDNQDAGQVWVDDLMNVNRFDGLQMDIREAALRDGQTFVMMEYDDEQKKIGMFHNLAWDGDVGVIVVMDASCRYIVAGVKAWYDGDIKRVNIYYQNSVEKYETEEGSTDLRAVEGPTGKQETTRNGEAPGVPIIRFSRKKKATSELKNVIPLQDSLNRTLVSMVMAAELTAFSVMFAVGWQPPQAITPGMIYHAKLTNADGTTVVPQSDDEARAMVAMLNAYRLERIQGGSLTELIKQADWIIAQIEKVTSTPVDLGGGSSGEYLKQLDVRLQGKIEGAQVRFGNSYEDMVKLAAKQSTLFGVANAPTLETVSTEWKSAEIRNDADVLALFKQLNDAGYERAALRALSKSSMANFTEDDIDQMIEEKAADTAATLQRAAGNLDGMGQFNFGTTNPVLN